MSKRKVRRFLFEALTFLAVISGTTCPVISLPSHGMVILVRMRLTGHYWEHGRACQ